MSTWKTIEEKLLKNRTDIRIIGLLKKRKESPLEFLCKFFTQWNSEKDTIYVESRQAQTKAGKRRSLGDVYLIMKYYYPKISLEEVKNLLWKDLLTHHKIPRMRSSYCHTINKRVYYQGDEHEKTGIFDRDEEDEFKLTADDYME